MRRLIRLNACLAVTLLAVLLLALPLPAAADGGIVVTEPRLWAMLDEGKQIAVIALGDAQTAKVDLFISLLDNSGESHKIVFFVPLGIEARGFGVVEESSSDFDSALTTRLDAALHAEAARKSALKSRVRNSLLVGSLLINGAWSWPLWLLVPLASCTRAPAPIATFETPGSQVAVFGLDDSTDLQSLIATTGLDPSVQETLSRLKGQRIAVINLQTQPPPIDAGGGGRSETGQPGIHLAWSTSLVSGPAGATYSYPLGTGRAWANPIEVTRIYVTAPPGIDFSVRYPRLGPDLSGYGGSVPRILAGQLVPSYATENAVGAQVMPFGRIWRLTYVQSNSGEDVLITRLPALSAQTRSELALMDRLQGVSPFAWFISLLAALAVWMVTWRYLMGRMLGVAYRWDGIRLWSDALRWSIVYPLANVAVVAVPLVLLLLTVAGGSGVPGWLTLLPVVLLGPLLLAGVLLLPITLPGLASLFFFAREQSRRLGISKRRAALAYAVVVLVANLGYLVFATAFALAAGAL